jgi:protein-histidine pros-kinase
MTQREESTTIKPGGIRDRAFAPLSEAVCRDLLEAAPIAIMVVAEQGEIVAANAEAEKMFGYRREELLGRSIETLLPARYRQSHIADRGAFNRNPEPRPMGLRRDLTALKKDGTEFAVEVGLSPVRTDHGLLVTTMITDLTARKRAERAILEHEETLRLLNENCPDLIAIVDPAGTIKFISRAITAITGYEPEEVTDRHFAMLLAPEHTLEAGQLIQRVMEGDRLEAFEYPLKRKDGSRVDVEFNSARFVVAGVTQGILAVGRDISARKRAEERIQELDRRKNMFVATVSHDLRTPLAVIDLALETVLARIPAEHELPGGIDGRSRASLDMARRNVKRLGRLIENLLDLARIEEGRLPLSRRRIDLRRLVEDAAQSILPLARKHGLELRVDLPAEEIEAEVDVDRITDVLTNLLGNAIRFARGEITTRIARKDGLAQIVVEDDGPGVPAEKIGLIFDRFARIEEHDGKTGTGLGLSISKGVVEAHGGELLAELKSGDEGGGMRFTVAVPL